VSGRILIAGIGNIFLADDGFGVEVVRRLAECGVPEGVEVVDFGIRGLDLAYALMDPYEALVFVDALPRGEEPGTIYLIGPEVEGEATRDTHGMDPVKVIPLRPRPWRRNSAHPSGGLRTATGLERGGL
jgi:hydrogenase maturation protease